MAIFGSIIAGKFDFPTDNRSRHILIFIISYTINVMQVSDLLFNVIIIIIQGFPPTSLIV